MSAELQADTLFDQEQLQKIKYNLVPGPEDLDLLLELLELAPRERQLLFLQKAYKRWLDINIPFELVQKVLQGYSPLEMAQKALQADLPVEVAQKILRVDSPVEVAQKILQVDSPVEVALKFIQNEEQLNEFLSRIQHRSQQTLPPTTGAAAGA